MSAILDAALEIPAEARAAHLDQACAGDLELRKQVDELLAADAAAGSFLAESALEQAAPLVAEIAEELDAPPPPHGRGSSVGAYRLLGPLGEGGMGLVYLAERKDGQFEHQVAVKVLRQGLQGEEAGRRFLQERRILARLQHPGIARLLDGGVTPDGSPFFVMERVEGRPVTAYCDERRLGIDARLRVFLEICEAVQYAHRRLVVHRDLKPSNILLDEAGRVKLLDFGIAKVLADGSEEAAAESTRTALRAMTPEYAAPEQVRGDPVTTATDVYALGVLLHELLTGQRPYRDVRGVTSELERAILEQEPTRPSARTGGAGLPGIGVAELRRLLRGDLDGIVLRALEKEPERRYPSAEALAADVRRHLEGLPVLARGDRAAYRARKFVRRHRVGAGAGLLVLVSLISGLAATAWQARRAQREARKAEAVKDFLKSLFAASDPAEAQGKERTARQLLEDGARRIETELKGQPEVQSEVARLVAGVYRELGEYDHAAPLLRADLERHRTLEGPRSVAAAETLTRLADVLYEQSRFDEAGALYEEALAIQRQRRGERSPEVAELLWDVAGVKRNRGDLSDAETLQRRALAIYLSTRGEDSSEVAAVRESLAITFADGDRYHEAAELQEPVVGWRERHYGPDHPNTLVARYNLAIYFLALGRSADAAQIAKDVSERQRRVIGSRHARLAATLRLLARAQDGTGHAEDALGPIGEALALHRESPGPARLEVALDLAWQGLLEARTGHRAEAERDGRDTLALLEAQPSMGPIQQANTRAVAGSVLAEVGRLEDADRELSSAIAAFRSARRSGIWFGRALDTLADVARQRGDLTRAAPLGQEALAVLDRSGGPDHPATGLARVHVGTALYAAGETGPGERLFRTGLGSLERAYAAGHADLAAAWFLAGETLARSGRVTEAQRLLQPALEWRRVHFGATDPRTVAVRRVLDSPAP